uniref:Uncharacterized protein n=1 Tax=Rhizophora mucronata TaxID=61149 RepID=A0A2P2Q751_RHIMU
MPYVNRLKRLINYLHQLRPMSSLV